MWVKRLWESVLRNGGGGGREEVDDNNLNCLFVFYIYNLERGYYNFFSDLHIIFRSESTEVFHP